VEAPGRRRHRHAATRSADAPWSLAQVRRQELETQGIRGTPCQGASNRVIIPRPDAVRRGSLTCPPGRGGKLARRDQGLQFAKERLRVLLIWNWSATTTPLPAFGH